MHCYIVGKFYKIKAQLKIKHFICLAVARASKEFNLSNSTASPMEISDRCLARCSFERCQTEQEVIMLFYAGVYSIQCQMLHNFANITYGTVS